MSIDRFRFTVAEEDYARAAVRVCGAVKQGAGLPSGIEIWIVRFLLAIAGVAGAAIMWMWSGSPMLTALSVVAAVVGYLMLERLALWGLALAERALAGGADRLIERQLRGTIGPDAVVGRVTIDLAAGGIILRSESGEDQPLRSEDVDRVVRDEAMTVIVRRHANDWSTMVVPVPDAGLEDGLDPMLVFEALQRSLSAGQP